MRAVSLLSPLAAPGKHVPPFAPDDPSHIGAQRDLHTNFTFWLLADVSHPHCTWNCAKGFEMMMSPSTAPSGAGLQDQGSARQLRKELAAGDVGREG